jgi:DNA helicase II / ATP-dependent DNA helicase PcrA
VDSDAEGVAHQVFGPPGTGKTRYLSERVKKIVEDYGPESACIASFSVTAAKEIGSRGIGLPQRRVGTLHSFAYRSLGSGLNVALDPKVLADWNKMVGAEWRLTADTRRAAPQAATEGGAQNTDMRTAASGDELLAALDRARATFTDPADFPPDLAAFAEMWTEWKQANEAVDYTDMIEGALERAREGEPAPGRPQVFIVDEAQDNTPLETELVLAWGKQASSLVVALDDDQAIMEWRGGDPRRLLTLGQGNDGYTVDRHVLGKSWRVPRSVHAVAERWVHRLSLRQEKVYQPRTRFEGDRDTGEIIEGAAYGVPESVQDPELADRIEEEIERDRTVMVIASCAYMLEPLTKTLRERGIPFHNPFRPTESRWNPLGGGNGTSTAERVFRYMVLDPDLPQRQLVDNAGHVLSVDRSRPWTGEDVRAWLPLVSAELAGLRRGVKAHADKLPDGEVPWEDIAELFADREALERAVSPDLEWLASVILPSRAKQAAYPLQVARKRGAVALDEKPKVVLGTIHSVKGAAADIVYVAPDMSAAGIAQLTASVSGRDQTIRLFYVAMTRAFEELRLLAPFSPRNYLKRRDLLPNELEVPA